MGTKCLSSRRCREADETVVENSTRADRRGETERRESDFERGRGGPQFFGRCARTGGERPGQRNRLRSIRKNGGAPVRENFRRSREALADRKPAFGAPDWGGGGESTFSLGVG